MITAFYFMIGAGMFLALLEEVNKNDSLISWTFALLVSFFMSLLWPITISYAIFSKQIKLTWHSEDEDDNKDCRTPERN
jgi:4-amino-4-deoxy-L-arabinose transferase-like glycosyltransferase